MNNNVSVNYMTRTYHSYSKSYETKTQKSSEKSFVQSAEEKSAEKAQQASKASATGTVSTADMTMEEYKQYIYDKISAIPIHPSRMQESIAIHISEEGFEAMKNDPEYEAWVLDYLKRDFAVNNPWCAVCGGSYAVEYFGASKEEHQGYGWYEGFQNGNGENLYNAKSQGCFWERKAQRAKRLEDQYEKMLDKRAMERRWQQERINAQLAARREEHSRLMKAWYSKKQMTLAFTAYEASVITEPAGSSHSDSPMTDAMA